MFSSHLGELAALLTAGCWAVSALLFQQASRRAGSLAVNLFKSFFALVFLSIYGHFARGLTFPSDATPRAWAWLSLSGLIGFVIGDLLLFQAFISIGARISLLIFSLVPPITALIGWLMLGERLTLFNLLGMALTLGGIALVILERGGTNDKVRLSHPLAGLLFAFGGSLCQAVGLVLSKFGMREYDPFAATQIRIITALAGFALVAVAFRQWFLVSQATRDRRAMQWIVVGSLFGPSLGVGLSLLAIQHTTTGVASTIMAIVPVLIIPPAVIFLKEKITLREVIGSLIAVIGVATYFV